MTKGGRGASDKKKQTNKQKLLYVFRREMESTPVLVRHTKSRIEIQKETVPNQSVFLEGITCLMISNPGVKHEHWS